MRKHHALLITLIFALQPQAYAESLKVMAYNIMQLNVQDWDQANRAARLPAALTQLSEQPDVILVSEAFNDEDRKSVV